MSATHRIIKKANDNRVLITLWLAIAGFAATQFINTRDHSLTQPFIDELQNEKITAIESDIKEIKTDVKTLLFNSGGN